MADINTLNLKPGMRLRTGGTTYEVTSEAKVPAGLVEIIPQKTRLLKVFCETCHYTCRITNRWIEKAGTPECPTHHVAMVVEVKEAKEEVVKVEKAAPTRRKRVPMVAPVVPSYDGPAYIPEDYDYEPEAANDPLVLDPDASEPTSTLADLLAQL